MAQATTLIEPQAAPPTPPAATAPISTSPTPTASIVMDTLNDLHQTCADGAYGFAACADYTNISKHRALFRQRAHDCDTAGTQLYATLLKLGREPSRGGSAGGAIHRGWVAVRGTLSGLRDQSILAECERGESVTLERYRSALSLELPRDVRALVQEQCDRVELSVSELKKLRNPERAAA